MDSGLGYLVLSIDGFTQESYKAYRVKGDVELVKRNLMDLVKIKKEKGVENPRIAWQFIKNKHNLHEFGQIESFCEEVGIEFVEFSISTTPLVDYIEQDAEDIEPKEDWLTPEQIENKSTAKPSALEDRCIHPWFRPVIHPDLKVAPCCYVSREESDFGDLKTHSLREVWNNEKYRYARALFTPGSRVPPTPDPIICERCPMTHNFREKRGLPPVETLRNGESEAE